MNFWGTSSPQWSALCLEEVGGRVWTGPAVRWAREECLSPTPLDPPTLLYDRVPERTNTHIQFSVELYFSDECLEIPCVTLLTAHLDAVSGSLLQIRDDGVVPQVDEPLPELFH